MSNIKQPDLIDTFNEEYHISESTDMMRYKEVYNPNRPRLLHHDEHLTDEEEKNERIAEQIAKKYGLMYFQQSCIAAKSNQFNDLLSAKLEISKYMKTDDIERPFASERKTADWLFVFYSDESVI